MSVLGYGKILKIYNSLYEVFDPKSLNTQTCHKQKKIEHLVVGDDVIFDSNGGKGNIVEVKPRKNMLTHPCIANVDVVFYISALKNPEYKLYQIDLFLAYLFSLNIKAKLVFTKKDLVHQDGFKDLGFYASLGFEPLFLNSLDLKPEEKKQIHEEIKNKVIVFAGGSGVGKSTLLKNLSMNINVKTDEISRKTLKGKQTTKQVSLYCLDSHKTFIADTPGFSFFDESLFKQIDLTRGFPEFQTLAAQCRFSNCSHQEEPDCSIKQAAEKKLIKKSRYDSYRMLYSQLEKIKKRCDY
ncbi:MAG: ribosome small subunit-dependent GTPase A [Candidatus Margulisbacteria bacterium]|nr:ribosome small subunit-dependent GTPase A [Candidatus Margulisiibacteriota bacterium]